MKTALSYPRQQQGNVLLMTVVITGLVGFTLASYLTLVKSQHQATMRSQAWNKAMPIVEAGIEEAMAHLNKNGTNRLDLEGWAKSSNVYVKKGAIQDGYYVVTISNWFNPDSFFPVIISRGYVRKPIQVVSRSDVLFATTTASPSTSTEYLSRGVMVTTRRAALFAKGMVAEGQIDLNGNNIDTDSFDSSDPNFSTPEGLYDPLKRKANGSVATNSGLTNSLSVGNANIAGHVSTGPGGSVSIGSQGIVGDLAWHAAKNKGIQPGWATDDMNVDFPDVDPLSVAGSFTPAPRVVDGVLYNYVLDNGSYVLNSLNLSGDMKVLVTGDATLYVLGPISISGNAYVEIEDDASLAMYTTGSYATLTGNGILNKSGNANNFSFWGRPTLQSLEVGGNGEFIGVIYAPSANYKLSGGGKDGGIDFIGASITKTVTMNGHFKFHYDESLGQIGLTRAYVPTSWNELPPDIVAASPTPSTEIIYPIDRDTSVTTTYSYW